MQKKQNQRKLTEFGVVVKKRLIEVDMTQVQLAEEVGTSNKYLNLILYGERSGKKYIDNIINTLGIDPEVLKEIA
ncbi:helix-turn-helix domain-containing protein [Clostridium amazonitimonense]|uniref:helix-turn-helix domain-containing protein n=1 Tax=Clostridium amazonitimonense TaxID=1499689 RepID=UPI000509D9DC|nr:helix-turn-helix transcriptional regulator [Clostridium amazonitimonense]